MEVRLFSLIEPICSGGGGVGGGIPSVLRPEEIASLTLSHCPLLCPLLGRAGSVGQYLSKMGRGSVSRICFGVIGSQTNLEGTKSSNWSQFCSFLLNRSLQETSELKLESKIEEVSLSSALLLAHSYICQPTFLGGMGGGGDSCALMLFGASATEASFCSVWGLSACCL